MKSLVTIEERKWIAEKGNHIEMGSKIKTKVVDVDKLVARMRQEREENNLSPYIEITSIAIDKNKTPNRLPTWQKDPKTGVVYGIPIDEDAFGNIRWQRIPMSDALTLNLDNENDARQWAILRYYPQIQGSPFQVQNPYYKIFDPVEKANEDMKEVEAMKIAFDHITSIAKEPKAMVGFCRYLGEDLQDNANEKIVTGALLNAARNAPVAFNKLWDSKNRSYGELFESARSLSIIVNELGEGFIYKGVNIGSNRDEAMLTLSSDTNIASSINREVSEKDVVVKNVVKSMQKDNSVEEETDFKE